MPLIFNDIAGFIMMADLVMGIPIFCFVCVVGAYLIYLSSQLKKHDAAHIGSPIFCLISGVICIILGSTSLFAYLLLF